MSEEESVIRHYESIREEDRLSQGVGRLEFLRTQEVLGRHLQAAPARVADIGGGTGVHATWLTRAGYRVHVVDLTPRHVERVLDDLGPLGVTAEVGDARRLDFEEGSFDAVLLRGPLYHLTERADRLAALAEARRVVRPSGIVAVAAISRFASLFDGLARGFLFDSEFRCHRRDLAEGQHRNPDERAHWFTTAYFHEPEDLRREIEEAGLEVLELVGLEGLAGMVAQSRGTVGDRGRTGHHPLLGQGG